MIAIANDSGTVTSINKYDGYGVPAIGKTGTSNYIGQPWLPEIGLNYHVKRTRTVAT